MMEIVYVVVMILLCCYFYMVLTKSKANSFKEGHSIGYRKGYNKGYTEGQDSVEIPAQPEWAATELVYSTQAEDDIYGPDTSEWSTLIPPATRDKLIQGITAFNRSTDQKRTKKKF